MLHSNNDLCQHNNDDVDSNNDDDNLNVSKQFEAV